MLLRGQERGDMGSICMVVGVLAEIAKMAICFTLNYISIIPATRAFR